MAIYYSLIDLWELSDYHLFDDISIYEKIDKDILINTIFDYNGENEPTYFDPDYYKKKIEIFFKKYYQQFKDYQDLLLTEYEVLYPDSWKEITTDDGTSENVISAYNESDYQNNDKNYTKNTNIKEHHGNGSGRTYTELINEKIEFIKRYNIYDFIARKFASELTVRLRYR